MTMCSTCKHFRPFANDEVLGQCRRHAPRPVLVNPREYSDFKNQMTVWPRVDMTDVCGEHEESRPDPRKGPAHEREKIERDEPGGDLGKATSEVVAARGSLRRHDNRDAPF